MADTFLIGGKDWSEVSDKLDKLYGMKLDKEGLDGMNAIDGKITKWYKTAEQYLESRIPKPLWINDGNGNILISPEKLHQFMVEYAEYIVTEREKS